MFAMGTCPDAALRMRGGAAARRDRTPCSRPVRTECDRNRYSPPMGGLSSTSQLIRVSGASEPATEQYLSNESCTARSTCSRGESVVTRYVRCSSVSRRG